MSDTLLIPLNHQLVLSHNIMSLCDYDFPLGDMIHLLSIYKTSTAVL